MATKVVRVDFAAKVVTITGAKTITEIRDPLWHVRELTGPEARLTVKGPEFIFEDKEKLSLTKPLDVLHMGLKWFTVKIKGKETYVQPTAPFELKVHLPKVA